MSRDAGLDSTGDALIWEYGKIRGLTFMTKVKDFANLSLAWGAPPKVVLLQVGNCSTAAIEGLIRRNAILLSQFENDAKRSLLILK